MVPNLTPRVKRVADLKRDDVVLTPSGREARVVGFEDGRVMLAYLNSIEGVTLKHHHLRIVQRAPQTTLRYSRIISSERRLED